VTLNLHPWVSEVVGKKCCEVLRWTSGTPLSWRCANDSEVARNGIDCLSILASDSDVRLRLIEVCDLMVVWTDMYMLVLVLFVVEIKINVINNPIKTSYHSAMR
jgi:hypothetical protein